MPTPSPVERAQAMSEVLCYADADARLIRESFAALEANVGALMLALKRQLLEGKAEEAFFDDDPERSQAFGAALSDFILKSSAAHFSADYCAFVAAFAQRCGVRPPASVLVAMTSIVGRWAAETLTRASADDTAKLAATLAAWHKLLAINLDLLLSGNGESQ